MSGRKAAPTRRRPRMWTGAVLACTGILLAAGSAQAANLDGEPRRLDVDLSSISASVAAPAQAGQITLLAIPRGVTVSIESSAPKLLGVAGAIASVGRPALNLAGGGIVDASPLDPTGPGRVIEAFGHVTLSAARVVNRVLIVPSSRDASINVASRPPPVSARAMLPTLPFINTIAIQVHCGAIRVGNPTTELIDITSDPTFANTGAIVSCDANSFGAAVSIVTAGDIKSSFWVYRANAALRVASGLSGRQPRSPYRERLEAT